MSSSKSIMVIGIDRLGSKVAIALIKSGHKVTILEKNQDRIDNFLANAPHANVVKTDVTNDNFSTNNNLSNFAIVVLTIVHGVEAGLNVANQIQKDINKHQKSIYFIACVNDDNHYDFLSKIGVEHIVRINEVMSNHLLAKITQQVNTTDFFRIDEEQGCFKILVSTDNQNLTLEELGIGSDKVSDQIRCLGVVRNKKFISLNDWQPNDPLHAHDEIVVIGRFSQVKILEERMKPITDS